MPVLDSDLIPPRVACPPQTGPSPGLRDRVKSRLHLRPPSPNGRGLGVRGQQVNKLDPSFRHQVKLEDVLQPKLNVSGHILLSADSSKRGWRVDVCGNAAEDHAVEEVKEFRSELKQVTLTDPEILQDAEIFIHEGEGTDVSVVRRCVPESESVRL